jgi:hypothetical protein
MDGADHFPVRTIGLALAAASDALLLFLFALSARAVSYRVSRALE